MTKKKIKKKFNSLGTGVGFRQISAIPGGRLLFLSKKDI